MSTTSVDLPPPPTNITDEQKYAAMKMINEEVFSEKGQEQLIEDIAGSIRRVNDFRANFRKLHSQFILVDADEHLKKEGYSFAEHWKTLYEDFITALDDSLFSASDIGSALNEFENEILKTLNDKEKTEEEKKKILEDFIDRVKDYEAEARRVKGAFQKLFNETDSFCDIFDSHFDNVLEVDKVKVKALEGQIAVIRGEIDGISHFFIALGNSSGTPLIRFAGVSFVPDVGLIAAIAAAVVFGVGIAVIIVHDKNLAVKQTELDHCQDERARLWAKSKLIEEGGRIVEKVNYDDSFLTTTSGFEGVWIQVMQKCVLFKNDFTAVKSDLDVKLYREQGRTYWGVLGDTMIKYAELHSYASLVEGVPMKKNVSPKFTSWVHNHPALEKVIKGLDKVNNPITGV